MHKYHSPISIPNFFTLLRIILTPLFVIFLLRDQFTWALAVFAIAGISDGLDGLIARFFNQRTALGAYLDPTADKLLLISAYIGLAVLNVVPAWVSVIVISRDVIIILGIAIFTLTQKSYGVHPTMLSKCTTTAQILTVMLSLFDPDQGRLALFHIPVLWTTAVLTMLSGLQYVYIGMSFLQEPNESEKNGP